MTNHPREKIDGIVVVSQNSEQLLNELQLEDYRDHRRDLINWALNLGKNPEQAEGYAQSTIKARARRLDKFYRWVWSEENGYTLNVSTGHADDFVYDLAQEDHSNSYKAGCIKALKMLFNYKSFNQHDEIKWSPPVNFSSGLETHAPRDYLTPDELKRLMEASLELGTIPNYHSVSPQERSKWKAYLAQRFEKPKNQIGLEDWEKANSWKFPSLVNVSIDAGFRPVEVGRAKVHWVDLDNNRLRIPKDESSKNRSTWFVSIRERTTRILGKWLEERSEREKYDGRGELWLTRSENPYSSNSLNKLLTRLCDEAGIQRDVSWYAIRHGAGTLISREEGLKAAQFQLRHKSPETTQKYDQAPEKDRRNALESQLEN